MHFRGSPESLSLILLVAMSVFVLHSLMKRRLESNLPLFFYAGVIAFMTSTGRALDAPLLVCGLASTLVLRFEFMNRYLTNAVWVVAVSSTIGILLQFVGEAFGIVYY